MYIFTLAFISCLSLSVHAASIGDSVSQVVTRDHQSIQEFHHPDFGLAHSESDNIDPAALESGTPAIHTRHVHKDASLP